MKPFVIAVLGLLLTHASLAQNDSLINQAATAVCDCLSRKDMNAIQTKEQADKAVMDCFMASGMSYMMKIVEARGLSMSDSKAMHELGKEIGKAMLLQGCKPFVNISMVLAKQTGEERSAEEYSISGVVTNVEEKDFVYITLKSAEGRAYRFIWLRYFPGSDELKNKLSSLKGKKLSVRWREIETYLPTAKDYFKQKEITEAKTAE